jgi:hypothetical protein
MQDLESTWSEITALLGSAAFQVFPAIPEPGRGPTVEWPGDDWRSFLDLALNLEVPLIYAEAFTFDAWHLEDAEQDLRDAVDPLTPQLLAARQHVGHYLAIQVAFSQQGVVHAWSREAEWFTALQDSIQSEHEMGAASADRDREEFESELESELERLEELSEEWATRLAESPDFYRARNDRERRAVAGSIVPELGEYLKHPGVSRRGIYSLALRILDDATRRVREDVLPRLAREALAHREDLAMRLLIDVDFVEATTKEDRQRRIRKLLEMEYGLSHPELVRSVYDEAQRLRRERGDSQLTL